MCSWDMFQEILDAKPEDFTRIRNKIKSKFTYTGNGEVTQSIGDYTPQVIKHSIETGNKPKKRDAQLDELGAFHLVQEEDKGELELGDDI
jgi:hypothetical protein